MASPQDALQRIQDFHAFLSEDLCAIMVNCTTNSFFSSVSELNGHHLTVAQESGSFWSAVPIEWQRWIIEKSSLDESQRDELLRRVASSVEDVRYLSLVAISV